MDGPPPHWEVWQCGGRPDHGACGRQVPVVRIVTRCTGWWCQETMKLSNGDASGLLPQQVFCICICICICICFPSRSAALLKRLWWAQDVAQVLQQACRAVGWPRRHWPAMPTARWSPRSLLRLGSWGASLCLPRTRFLSRTSSNMEPDHCLPNTSLHKWEDRGKDRVFLRTPRSRRPPRHKGRPTRRQLCRFHFIVNVLIINRP